MKKESRWVILLIVITIMAIVMLCCLTSCADDSSGDDKTTRFYVIDMYEEPSTAPLRIYVDKETRVQYLYNTYEGGMCVMVDKDGKPLLYGGTFND